jgi:hypothetical protein
MVHIETISTKELHTSTNLTNLSYNIKNWRFLTARGKTSSTEIGEEGESSRTAIIVLEGESGRTTVAVINGESCKITKPVFSGEARIQDLQWKTSNAHYVNH